MNTMNKLLLCSDITKEFVRRARLKALIYLDRDLEKMNFSLFDINPISVTICFYVDDQEEGYQILLTDTECNMDDEEFESHLKNNIESWRVINSMKLYHSRSM